MLDRARHLLWRYPSRAHLLLALLVAATWSTAVHPGTVNFDTPWLVTENGLLRTGSIRMVPAILFDLSRGTRLTLGAEYLPVRDLSVLMDYALFSERWALHHLSSLLWYMAGCLLFLEVAVELLGRGLRAWFAAALYAVHPLHAESVAWLASRKDLVSLAFVFLALLAWLRRDRWRGGGLVSVVAFALAYWAKNTAIVLPGMMVLISLGVRRDSPGHWRWWAQWLPYAAVTGVGLWLTLRVGRLVAMYAPPRASTSVGLMALEAQVVARYIAHVLWPTGLSVLYAEPTDTSVTNPRVAGAVLLVGGLLALGIALVRRAPRVSAGILWFFVALLPVSQIVPIQNLSADRYLLLPSAGAAIALAAAVPRLQALIVAAPLAVGLLAGVASARAKVWHSSLALWTDAHAKQPARLETWSYLAGAQAAAGHLDEAEATLRAGLKRFPDDALLLQSLGGVLYQQGRLKEADPVLRRAFALDPNRRKAANNLAVLLQRTGRVDEAIDVARALTKRAPLYAPGWNTLGAALLNARRLAEAEAALKQATALAPYNADAACNLGGVAWLRNQPDEAARWWKRCLALDPSADQAKRGLAALRKRSATGAASDR